MSEVYEILKLAAEDSEQAYKDNLDREPSMRMSRAGLPLLQLLLEDFVFPRLPKIGERPYSTNAAEVNRLHKRKMALSLGFLYEKVVGAFLAEEYPDFTVFPQAKLTWEGITGTCDYLLLDELNQQAVVIECKALDVETLKEAKDRKLLVDNWGYRSQLALYQAAVEQAYPEFDVSVCWRLWSKKSSKSFSYVPKQEFAGVLSAVIERSTGYYKFKEAFSVQDIDACVLVMMRSLRVDPLPLKDFYYGQLCGSCGLHFSPWADALLDINGMPQANIKTTLKRMVSHCFKPEENILELLDNQPLLAV